jgi:hypothetical protein
MSIEAGLRDENPDLFSAFHFPYLPSAVFAFQRI